jgi:Fic-DOC domain mobile mystery protein B
LTDPTTTPLDPDEVEGLRLSWVASRADLNSAEGQNIADALSWASRRRFTTEDVLEDRFLRDLHRRMFGDVWRWAGAYRRTEKNIGVDPLQISVAVRSLVDDARCWIADRTVSAWTIDEVGVRFHQRLTWIHPFPNGNGRHGRLATDLLVTAMGTTAFTWGRENLDNPGEIRSRYISALGAADAHDFAPLLEFGRS